MYKQPKRQGRTPGFWCARRTCACDIHMHAWLFGGSRHTRAFISILADCRRAVSHGSSLRTASPGKKISGKAKRFRLKKTSGENSLTRIPTKRVQEHNTSEFIWSKRNSQWSTFKFFPWGVRPNLFLTLTDITYIYLKKSLVDLRK